MKNNGNKKRNIRWTLVLYDIVIYLVVAALLLVLYGGNDKLATVTVIQQMLLSAICVFAARLIGNVYGQVWRYGGIQCYIRLLFTDAIAFWVYVLLEMILPVHKITFARMLALFCMNVLGALTLRMMYRYAYKCGNQETLHGRFLAKLLYLVSGVQAASDKEVQKIKIAIIGAGRVGVSFAEELLNNEEAAYIPRCFIDTNKEKVGREIQGIPVYSEDEATLKRLAEYEVQEIVFAIPSMDADKKKALYEYYKKAGYKLKVYDYPTVYAAGGKRHLREFDIEELLFRKPLVVTDEKTYDYYRNKVILITGGGGSIGSELCRQLAKMNPRKLIILDIYENGAYDVQQELKIAYKGKLDLQVEIASITNRRAMERVFEQYHPQIIINAAAHKHVPLMEHNCIEAIENNVSEALRSGWITTGPKTKELEKEVAEFCGVSKAVCLSSQTACAEMTLRLLGISEGDEVITCAYTYTASASVVCHVGAKLVMVDTQKDSLEMDYDKLAEVITEKTKVIIPVDLGGVPCDYDRIFSIVESKKALFHPTNKIQEAIGRVIVMADAAHAFGATWKGKPVGSIADFSNFSFHAVKNFTTAEGGAVTWHDIEGIDNEELYHQYQLLSLHGQSKDALAKTQLGAWEYDIVGPWFKCNMTDVVAGIGLAQMKRYRGLLARRKKIIEKYDAAFKPLGIEVLNHYTDEHQSSGHLYITRVPGITLEQRHEIIVKMAEAGVACNVHYKPLPMMTAYKNLGFDIENYPNAYKQFENEITLPLHTKLTNEEVDYVIKNYCQIVKSYIKKS